MLNTRDLIRVLHSPLQEVSDWISLARPSHLDYGAVAEVSLYLAGGSCEASHSSIHPSAWKKNSRKFTPCLQTRGVIPMTDASSDLNDPCSRNHSCTPTRDPARKVSNTSGRSGGCSFRPRGTQSEGNRLEKR